VRLKNSMFTQVMAIVIAALIPGTCIADVVPVPSGTRVFIELDQEVTSKRKHNQPGSFVRAHVWRDVVIDGRTVAETGAPVMVKIGEIKPAKVAGIKGEVELVALQVPAIDGTDLMLTGGYDQSGKSLMALSITLAVVVFVPLIFIKGKQAKLPPGTVFDATVLTPANVEVPNSQPRKITLALVKPLEVTVLYDVIEQQGDKKIDNLPLQIRTSGREIKTARVTHVNNAEISPIEIEIGDVSRTDADTYTATATVDLKALGKNFARGFNQFTVDVDGETEVVLLDIEL